MENVVKIASYICQRYLQQFGKRIDGIKLQKLLYFTQRESIIQTGEPMFKEQFEARKYGPVLSPILHLYKDNALHESLSDATIEHYKKVFDTVFTTYAPKDELSLNSITPGEYAWQQARQKQSVTGRQTELIATDDIKKDANRVKIRRFLYENVIPQMSKSNQYANQ